MLDTLGALVPEEPTPTVTDTKEPTPTVTETPEDVVDESLITITKSYNESGVIRSLTEWRTL